MRVIAGRLGGRRLRAPHGSATRPTADRVREALFSVLGDLDSARVLDLYAGSGALGIEALSRGASHATFVERARPAVACIRANLAELELEAFATVVPLPVERARRGVAKRAPYDLVLCDPPWPELDRLLPGLWRLLSPDLLAKGARISMEHPASMEIVLPAALPLELLTRRTWGDTGVTLFRLGSQT
jgi:16S rRNA (guanine966-N2)-methyltransferase